MIISEGNFLITKAYQEILIKQGNTSDLVINAYDKIDSIYYLWLKYIYKNYNELNLFELDYFKSILNTKFGINITRLAKIYLEGEFNKPIDNFEENEFYEGMGFYLKYFLNERKEFIDEDELELYLKLSKVNDQWSIPLFLKFIFFMTAEIKIIFENSDNLKYCLGWFIYTIDILEDKNNLLYFFYEKIKLHLLSKKGFSVNESKSISLIEYYTEFDKNFSIVNNLDKMMEWKSNLVGKDLGFYLSNGVTIVGMALGELGIGEDLRQVSKCFDKYAVDYSIFNYPKKISSNTTNNEVIDKIKDYIVYDTMIFNLTAEETLSFFLSYGNNVRKNRYIIGYWPWELSIFPDNLLSVFDYVDEIWAPSKFIESSLKKVTQKPVFFMGLPVEYEIDGKNNHRNLNEIFRVLTIFDGLSYPSRKNIFNSIDVFIEASKKCKNMIYIIKTMNLEKTNVYQKIKDIVKKNRNIILINECYSREDTIDLISSADCLMSIHRSEGFGRVIAEAMLLKTLVVTSNYSGNIDFSKKDNCLLVEGKLVPLKEKEYPYYKDQFWFEPSISDATKQLINAYNLVKTNNETYLLNNAYKTIKQEYNSTIMLDKYKERLNIIWNEIPKKGDYLYDSNFYKIYNQDLKNIDILDHMFKYGVQENRNLSIFSLRSNKKLEFTRNVLKKENMKILVSIHSYYFEENESLNRYLSNLRFHDYDIIVNIPENVATKEHLDYIKNTYDNLIKINISENKGRDVGGLINNLKSIELDEYDIVFILQTKKSPQNNNDYTNYWKTAMLEPILGSVKNLEETIYLLRADNNIAAVGSLEWKSTHMNDNKKFVNKLFDDLKIHNNYRNLEYLSGSMFAIKINIIKDIIENLSIDNFESATNKSKEFLFDGQLEHAVERIYGSLLKSKNQKIKWI